MPTQPKDYYFHASDIARRLTNVTPSAKSDPFFARRAYSHFVNGVESPEGKVMEFILGHERRQAAQAQREAPQEAAAPVSTPSRRKRRKPSQRAPRETTGAIPVRTNPRKSRGASQRVAKQIAEDAA